VNGSNGFERVGCNSQSDAVAAAVYVDGGRAETPKQLMNGDEYVLDVAVQWQTSKLLIVETQSRHRHRHRHRQTDRENPYSNSGR
jgi:hypothetical protein